ncbi:MAG: tRNA lysidine(34) synthetase TilS [Deltaproteobacteria bacterium]|nr:tRNA lysidine(34) synthetase TilS [Deltaproteobacteria bacterium]MBI3017179.1 tRNA lysidine(34) synthetase TilS [Deltaproteobacteria bacterium]
MRIQKQVELKVLKFIFDQKLISSGDSVLVAVSGGGDSVSLLVLLAKWAKVRNWTLKVAYFDHGLRRASKKEALFVERLARKLELPFVRGYANCKALKKISKLSTEEIARKIRYEFLRKEAEGKIALAHHMNDQVETFFVALLKGGGLGGLSGMKSQEGNLIRPLLSLSKEEILAYLKSQKISFLTDETNVSHPFLRNKVRHQLLPYIERVFPEWNLLKTLPRLMSVLKAEHELLGLLARHWEEQFVSIKGAGYAIGTKEFLALPSALQRRIIKNTLEKLSSQRNFTSSHIEENRKLFSNPVSQKILMLPEGVRAKKLKNEVFFNKII